jgi:hypothetical protein
MVVLCKVKQPLNDDPASVSQFVDLYDVLSVGIVLWDIFQEQVAVHQDAAQRRIQFMGDFAGQFAGRLQPFGSKEFVMPLGGTHSVSL